MRVSVIGLGLIGGSVALDLRSSRFAQEIIGVDNNPEHCRLALGRLVDKIENLEAALVDTDLVILATPVDAIAKMLPQILSLAPANASITDLGSTKESICQSVVSHASRARYIASHPMAGTENSGPTAALPGLFIGKTVVICDTHLSGKTHLAKIEKMYAALQMRVIYMSSADHDRHVAFVSHLSHISSFVLAHTVLAEETNTSTIFDLAGGGFESTVRLAKSSPEMWTPIFAQNQSHIATALESYISHLQSFHQSLVQKKFSETKALMEDANRIRRVLASISREPGKGSA